MSDEDSSAPRAEIRRLVDLAADPGRRHAVTVVSEHFSVIQGRSQLLVSLIAIALTITGFSGPLIAKSSSAARVLIAAGLFLSVTSAAVLLLGVLQLVWLTADPRGIDAALEEAVRRRDRKTRRYRWGLVLLAAGLMLYGSAVGIYLLGW